MSPQAGDCIGPYTLVRELGRGAVGAVWLAERRGMVATTQVAVKLPLHDDQMLEAFRHEARIWVQVSGHPNVLPVIEAEVYDGRIVIVSEYAAGGSLSTWLKRHPNHVPPRDQTVTMITGIVAGLGHLHARAIIHRDLKPANVLLQEGVPRLTDFGMARVLQSVVHSYSVGGTPAYMAPEAWDGKRSEASDFWSVGIILHEMLTGARPFPQTELMPLFRAISSDRIPPLPPDLPTRFDQIIQKCLEKTPERRYRSADELLADLRTVTLVQDAPTKKLPAAASSDNLLHQIWGDLDPDLQDALALAFNQARREKKDRISTRTFFAALGRLQPGHLPDLLKMLPEGAMPDPIAADVATRSQILDEQPQLSTCVENALTSLRGRVSPGQKLGAEEVFVDVAKYGTGPSVARLRAHGVTPEAIERLVGQLGWKVVRR